jgi:copper resistance protein B
MIGGTGMISCNRWRFGKALPTAFLFLVVIFSDGAFAGEGSQPNLDGGEAWPSPVMDSETYGLFLADLLEYEPSSSSGESGNINWDLLAWRGGDISRIWFKSEGRQNATLNRGGEGDVRLLYGHLISPFFDVQAGVRYERGWGRDAASRFQAVLSLQGLAPYSFDIEPELYISNRGEVSFRFTAEQDFLFTQRLILQPRLETGVSLQSVPSFGEGAGLNDLTLGARLRYEFWREFAPYVGVSWENQFGGTADFSRRAGRSVRSLSAVAGLRVWI